MVKPTLVAEFNALSPEMVILHTEPTYKSLYQKLDKALAIPAMALVATQDGLTALVNKSFQL
jgi:hypothetical protein